MSGDFQALLNDVEKTLTRLRHEIGRLQHLILTDELTGLYNRRYLEVRLVEELNRAQRYHRSFSLLFLDLDDFKSVNERFGHPAGDRLLAEFGQVLRENARAMDVVFRYGGEEFLLLLPETGLEAALEVGQRLQRQVAQRAFLDGCLTITFSGGAVSFPADGSDPETLVQRADIALRVAKAQGKNRIVAAARLGPEAAEVAAACHRPPEPRWEPPEPVVRRLAVPGFRQGNLLPASFWSGEELFRVRALVAHEPAEPDGAERFSSRRIRASSALSAGMASGTGWAPRRTPKRPGPSRLPRPTPPRHDPAPPADGAGLDTPRRRSVEYR